MSLGIVFNSYILPAMLGFFAIVGNLLAIHYQAFVNYFPWTQAFHIIAVSGLQKGSSVLTGNILWILSYSFIGMVLFLSISIVFSSRKDIT